VTWIQQTFVFDAMQVKSWMLSLWGLPAEQSSYIHTSYRNSVRQSFDWPTENHVH